VAIPSGRSVTQEEAESKVKYKSFCGEIQRMWNMYCVIIPVIIGTTGIVTKALKNNLGNTLGKL
jgi:hypothetical protein